jgi:hypothetical protein
MNPDFHHRWQQLTQQARQASPAVLPDGPPYGFTTRLLAQFQSPSANDRLSERLAAFGLRAVITSALAFAAALALLLPLLDLSPLQQPWIETPISPVLLLP